MLGIGALIATLFSGVVGIQNGISKPKKQLPICQVEKAQYNLIKQCPANSLVFSQGKKLGKWDGVELKK